MIWGSQGVAVDVARHAPELLQKSLSHKFLGVSSVRRSKTLHVDRASQRLLSVLRRYKRLQEGEGVPPGPFRASF